MKEAAPCKSRATRLMSRKRLLPHPFPFYIPFYIKGRRKECNGVMNGNRYVYDPNFTFFYIKF